MCYSLLIVFFFHYSQPLGLEMAQPTLWRIKTALLLIETGNITTDWFQFKSIRFIVIGLILMNTQWLFRSLRVEASLGLNQMYQLETLFTFVSSIFLFFSMGTENLLLPTGKQINRPCGFFFLVTLPEINFAQLPAGYLYSSCSYSVTINRLLMTVNGTWYHVIDSAGNFHRCSQVVQSVF